MVDGRMYPAAARAPAKSVPAHGIDRKIDAKSIGSTAACSAARLRLLLY
jgi:hypothetical protein